MVPEKEELLSCSTHNKHHQPARRLLHCGLLPLLLRESESQYQTQYPASQLSPGQARPAFPLSLVSRVQPPIFLGGSLKRRPRSGLEPIDRALSWTHQNCCRFVDSRSRCFAGAVQVAAVRSLSCECCCSSGSTVEGNIRLANRRIYGEQYRIHRIYRIASQRNRGS